jgi:hypothetical protein
MIELIIKQDLDEKELEELMVFMRLWGVEAEIKQTAVNPVKQRVRKKNNSESLSDEELTERLSGEISDVSA